MPGNVLIIDDEDLLRTSLVRILKNAGYSPYEASNGRQALEWEDYDNLDLALLDIHLPDIDGVEVLRQLRHKSPRLSVIMLTGYGSLDSAIESMRLGAIDYLQKPINPEILVARVRVIIEEQYIERRKANLRDQIAQLQRELNELEAISTRNPLQIPMTHDTSDRFIKKGRLILDLKAKKATYGEEVLNLPPATFEYLCVLARYSPEVVDYRALVQESQSYQVSLVEARELAKWHIHMIRSASKNAGGLAENLFTSRGTGYRLILD